MKKMMLFLILFLVTINVPAGYQSSNSLHHIALELLDGSLLKGTAELAEVRVDTDYGFIFIDFGKIKRLEKNKDLEPVSFFLENGDQIKGFASLDTIELNSLVGELKIEMNDVAKLHKIPDPNRLYNVALHKKVIAVKKMSAHTPAKFLTDGKNAYPPAHADGRDFQAIVDLQKTSKPDNLTNPSQSSFHIHEIVVNWDCYGSQITDIKIGKVYKYINEYKIEYQTSESSKDDWKLLHGYNGIPITENNENVKVYSWIRKTKNQEKECVKTTLSNLNIENVTKFRITAKSIYNHIGIYEFEAFGVAK